MDAIFWNKLSAGQQKVFEGKAEEARHLLEQMKLSEGNRGGRQASCGSKHKSQTAATTATSPAAAATSLSLRECGVGPPRECGVGATVTVAPPRRLPRRPRDISRPSFSPTAVAPSSSGISPATDAPMSNYFSFHCSLCDRETQGGASLMNNQKEWKQMSMPCGGCGAELFTAKLIPGVDLAALQTNVLSSPGASNVAQQGGRSNSASVTAANSNSAWAPVAAVAKSNSAWAAAATAANASVPNDGKVRNVLDDIRGLPVMLQAMDTLADNVLMQTNSLNTLTSLAADPSKAKSIVEAGTIAVIFCILDNHRGNQTVLSLACKVLGLLAEAETARNKTQLEEPCPMGHTNPESCKCSAAFIRSQGTGGIPGPAKIAWKCVRKDIKPEPKAYSISALLRTMDTLLADAPAQAAICHILAIVSADPWTFDSVLEPESWHKSSMPHAREPEARQAIAAMVNFREAVVFIQSTVMYRLVRAMKHHRTNTKIQEHACVALYNLYVDMESKEAWPLHQKYMATNRQESRQDAQLRLFNMGKYSLEFLRRVPVYVLCLVYVGVFTKGVTGVEKFWGVENMIVQGIQEVRGDYGRRRRGVFPRGGETPLEVQSILGYSGNILRCGVF